MLGLGLSLQKGVSAFNAGRALVSSYIRRVISDGGVLQNTACDVAAINELNQDRLLDPASWVLVPDGIKEDVVYAQKPSTGLGDLTFTRASDATYTDSTGVVRRSPYNLASWSEMFSDASWSKTGITVTPNVALAPNGTMTADRIQFSSSNRALTQNTSLGTGVVCTASFYVLGTAGETLLFAAGGLDQLVTLTGSWQRISTTKTSINSTINVSTFGGATARDIFLWGAQLVEGTSALDYFPTTDRLNVPRIDFRNADGTLSSCGRLLLEPQRTNSIRNSSMVGAVAGSPGTLPTNWGYANTAGLTRSVVGVGTENGLPYIDVRINGTASASQINLSTDLISASSSQVWSSSAYIKIIAQPSPPLLYRLQTVYVNGGTYVNESVTAYTPTTTLSRFTATHTAPASTITSLYQAFSFILTIGQSYDFTIRIAAPQMELGAYATTWVPTTTAAVTRLADTAIKTGISSLIGQTEGTLFVEINSLIEAANNRDFLYVSSGSVANFISFFTLGTTLYSRIRANNGALTSITKSGFTSGTHKMALAYANNDLTMYLDGVFIGQNTAASVAFSLPLLDVAVGNGIAGTTSLGGGITQAALFPTRLTNDQLEVLTSEGYGNYALLAQSLNCVLQ